MFLGTSVHATRQKKRPRTGLSGHSVRIRDLAVAMLPVLLIPALIAGCGPGISPTKRMPPKEQSLDPGEEFTQTGIASWYGPGFHGQQTACGETYDMYALTAAHKRLPFQSKVRVTNLDNGEQVVVRITDRGPFRKQRIIDLSFTAAQRLDMIDTGTAPVRIEMVTPGPSREKRYTLQLGSFTQEENAQRSKRRARRMGLSHVQIHKAQLNGRRYYRVQAGQFTSRSEAKVALNQVRSRFPGSFILTD